MIIYTENYLSPQCCDEAEKTKSIFLDFVDKKDDVLHNKCKPVWSSFGINEKYNCLTTFQVYYCPFCGQKVPEIELNDKIGKSKIYNSDTGDYCKTCGERSMSCECLPPEFRWKPINKNVKLPKKKITDWN